MKGIPLKESAGGLPAPFALEQPGDNQPTRKPGAGSKPSPSREFSDAWCAAFWERFGAPYLYTVADGVNASRLLKQGVTPAQIMAVAKAAWSMSDQTACWSCVNQSSTVAKLVGAWANITAELKRANEKKVAASRMRIPKGNY